jgi:hypothetical protein
MPEEAIIEIDVGLTGKTKQEIDDYLAKVGEIKEGKPVTEDQVEAFKEVLGDLGEKEIEQLTSIMKNPQGFLTGQMEGIFARLGPTAPLIGTIVGAIIASGVLFIELMKFLSQKGGPFNRDWRRFIANEVDVGLNRELQKRKELGIDQVIISQLRGFTPNNPGATYNSLYEVNETRIARIGLDDRAAGVIVG